MEASNFNLALALAECKMKSKVTSCQDTFTILIKKVGLAAERRTSIETYWKIHFERYRSEDYVASNLDIVSIEHV